MDKDQKDKEKPLKKPKIIDSEGLHISYEKNELEKQFPNLMSEISNKKNILKINSVNLSIEPNSGDNKLNETQDYHEDLKNPGVIDFIRRCSTKNEAIEILDYLHKRKEITHQTYKKLRNQIQKKDGLKKLIEECGGFKTPGYYEKNFYDKKI
ncbi:MAG: DUF2095 family protein [Promethearchaeota archaeon]